jgi:hypothetical protein
LRRRRFTSRLHFEELEGRALPSGVGPAVGLPADPVPPELTIAPPPLLVQSATTPAPVALVADLTGDGAADLVEVDPAGHILLQPGQPGQPGVFGPAQAISGPSDPPALSVVLVSGGPHAQLAAILSGNHALVLYTRQLDPTTSLWAWHGQLLGGGEVAPSPGTTSPLGNAVLASSGSSAVFSPGIAPSISVSVPAASGFRSDVVGDGEEMPTVTAGQAAVEDRTPGLETISAPADSEGASPVTDESVFPTISIEQWQAAVGQLFAQEVNALGGVLEDTWQVLSQTCREVFKPLADVWRSADLAAAGVADAPPPALIEPAAPARSFWEDLVPVPPEEKSAQPEEHPGVPSEAQEEAADGAACLAVLGGLAASRERQRPENLPLRSLTLPVRRTAVYTE